MLNKINVSLLNHPQGAGMPFVHFPKCQ